MFKFENEAKVTEILEQIRVHRASHQSEPPTHAKMLWPWMKVNGKVRAITLVFKESQDLAGIACELPKDITLLQFKKIMKHATVSIVGPSGAVFIEVPISSVPMVDPERRSHAYYRLDLCGALMHITEGHRLMIKFHDLLEPSLNLDPFPNDKDRLWSTFHGETSIRPLIVTSGIPAGLN